MKWQTGTINRSLVILELGVGFEYPSVLRFPDEKMAFFNQKSTLVRIHSEFPQIPKEIRERSLSVTADPVDFWSK